MNTEEKKIDIQDKLDGSENHNKPNTKMDGIETPLSDEDSKVDEKDDIEEKEEIKDSSENIETENIESEPVEKEDKIEEERELTKEDIENMIKKSLERDEFLDKLQRTKAEYLNYQKRKNKEIGDIRRFAIQDFAIALTSVLDNFTRALHSTKESNDFDKFLEGIQLVEDQFYKTLEDFGVKPIETVGKSFDPVMHEAVIEEEDNNHDHHTVIMELQRGFLLHGRVIRPAKVKVSKKSEKEDEESKQESGDENGEVKETEEKKI